MKKLTIACIALALSAGPALAEKVGYRHEMDDCQKACVDTYGPKVDAYSEGAPSGGESFGEHRKKTLSAIDELNACLKACKDNPASQPGAQESRKKNKKEKKSDKKNRD